MLRSPPIRVKAGTGNGFITAPTVWKLPPVGQGFEVRLPVEIHRHGVDDQVKLTGQRF